jgi:hypothetical protein
MQIAQGGMNKPVLTYEGKILEGRVRYLAAGDVGVEPKFRDWVLWVKGDKVDPLDWIVRKHVETHELSELDKIKLVAAILPYYRDMPGSTHKRLYEATRLPWNKIRLVDWLQDGGVLEPVLSGQADLIDRARAAGLLSDKRGVALGTNYGAGDRFDEAIQPIKRYLAAWKRKGYEFRHINPREAARRLSLVESLIEELQAAKPDLEKRSTKATLSAPPERKVKS